MKIVSSVLCICLVFCAADMAVAEILKWPAFPISEDQVKNGPEGDGSTNSTATGTGTVTYNTDTNEISYTISWTGLQDLLTKIHVHGPAAPSVSNPTHLIELIEFDPSDIDAVGTPTIPDSPGTSFVYSGNRTTGSVSNSHQLEASHEAGDETDIISVAEIVDALSNGMAYVNVHSVAFPMGEIRGNVVPEPASAVIIGIGSLALIARRKRI